MGMSSDSDWLIILLLLIPTSTMPFSLDSPYNCDSDSLALAKEDHLYRDGTRGRVQGVCPPTPHPRDDLWLSNTTGVLQNTQICMICILSSSHYVIA